MTNGKKTDDLQKKLLELAREHNINPKQLEAMIESEKYKASAPTIDLSEYVKDGKVLIGVLSDTRVNNRLMRPGIYKSLYAKFKEEKVSYVFHCGDITDGYMRYTGHVADQIFQSYDEMLETFFDPKLPVGYPLIGANTYFIGGNCDKTFLKRKFHRHDEGTNVCEDISEARKDLIFAGWNGATIKVAPKTKVRLSHPLPGIGSRKPYAISYPVQNKVNAFGGGQKPDILLSGYFQKRFEFEARGINVQMIGSCIGQTPYDTEKNISAPALGGVILEIHFKKDGSQEEVISMDLPFYD